MSPDPWRTDSLPVLESRIWSELSRAVSVAEAPWRTPVVSNVADAGRAVDARVMVLRGASRELAALKCFTDSRSPKMHAAKTHPRLAWTFFDPVGKLQLRAATRVRIHAGDAVAAAAWQHVPEGSRRNYATRLAPGTPVDGPAEDNGFVDAAAAHFAVWVASVDAFDWLWMADDGHRRAVFRYDDTGRLVDAGWRVP